MNKKFALNPLFLAMTAIGSLNFAPHALAQEQDSAINDIEEEEVVVLGIRRSLQNAADLKRNAETIMDAISAEDMGKLPDANAAESLRRVTGVQIGTRNGQGSSVRIRGMAEVNIEVDGLVYVGTGTGGDAASGSNVSRNIGLEDIPSELLSGIEVIKSQTADMNEGGLTGTVRLKTRSPLDIDGHFIGGNVKRVYSDAADESNDSLSLYFSNNWDDTVGVMLNISDLKTLTRNDTVEFRNWGPLQFLGVENAGQSDYLVVTDDQGRQAVAVAPGQVVLDQREVDQDRIATNMALQLRPTDSLDFTLKVLHSEYEELRATNTLNFGPRDPNSNVLNGGITLESFVPTAFGEFTEGVGSNGVYQATDAEGNTVNRNLADAGIDGEVTLLQGAFSIPSNSTNGSSHRASGQAGLRDAKNTNINLSGSWSGENLHISASSSLGKSSFHSTFIGQDVNGSHGNVNGGFGRDPRPIDPYSLQPVALASNLRFSYNMGASDVGGLALDPTLRGVNPTLEDGGNYLTDPYSYVLGFTGLFISEYTTDQNTNQIDVDWDIDSEWANKLEFGVRTLSRTDNKESYRGVGVNFQYRCTDDSFRLDPEGCARNGAFFTNAQIGANDANSLYIQPENRQDLFIITDGSFLSGVDGVDGLPRQWISGNPLAFANDPLGRLRNDLNMTPMRDRIFDYTVDQSTTALYAKVNFDFLDETLNGNFGVRYVDTDFDVSGFRARDNAQSLILSDDIFREIDYIIDRETISVTEALPSLNLSWDAMDELKVRFAANRAMAYQDFDDLVPGERITSSLAVTGIKGNPDLKPWLVDQYDVSVEWYFDENSGGNLSAALFYKDFDSFITTQTVPISGTARGVRYCVEPQDGCVTGQAVGTQSINGTGEVTGFELGYNQPLPLGFGFFGNYTYLDSEDSDGNPIPNNSEHTYNLVAYYEDFGFNARLAYFWQDQALLRASGFNGASDFRKARGQLDASVGYDLGDRVSFSLSVTNITQEVEEDFSRIEERLLAVRQFDRQVIFSARGRF